MNNQKTIRILLGLSTFMLVACSHHQSETLNSTDTVTVSRNVSDNASSQESSSLESYSSSMSSETLSLSKEVINKIEKAKNIKFTDQFLIVVVSETSDMIEVNIRKDGQTETSSFGFFRYTKSSNLLEELNVTTGQYEILPNPT